MSIRIRGLDKNIDLAENNTKTLLEVLSENGISVPSDCAGKGRCGQCKIRILRGEANKVENIEKELLNRNELAKNTRLACRVDPVEDMEIEIPAQEQHHPILSTGLMREAEYQPIITKKLLEIEQPSLDNRRSYEEIIKSALNIDQIPLNIIGKLSKENQIYTAVYFNEEIIDLELGDTTENQYGIAVDIGTTTVVATLVDLTSGEQLESEVRINDQTKYGADVLSRISYVIENDKKGLNRLQRAITNSINMMIKNLCDRTEIDRTHIYQISVAANTTMNHLLLNIDPVSIGRSPYVPMLLEEKDISAKELGLRSTSSAAYLSTLPSVSSYVGSDIVAGIFVSGINQTPNKSILIDIGTNGEIVLADHGKLVSCSCAAGPALEGMNISSGMKAADGAIEDVQITDQGIELAVIGDTSPIGLCGSGVLATIRELIRNQLINKRGRIVDPESLDDSDYRKQYILAEGKKRAIKLTENILVSQKDVRQIQLTKAAILSGITALLEAKDFEPEEIEEIFVAGQFGSHIPEESFIETGIFPKEFSHRINYIGNTSHSGAYLNLISKDARTEMSKIGKNVDYIELSVMDNYEKLFTKSSQFTIPE